MDLDSAALRALSVLAEELHFGRAAVRLGITQQALSKRISRLEADLHASLVDRSQRTAIRLTPTGHGILPLANEALSVVDRLTAYVGEASGRIRVDVMADYLAPTTWLHRATQATDLPLDAVERPADTTADFLLRTGRASLAFGRAGAVPLPWPQHIRRRLFLLEPVAVLVPPDHPWAEFDHVPLASLAGHNLWFPMAAAPFEWRDYVTELATHAHLTVDTTGSTFGYRQWAKDVTEGLAPPSLIGEAMTPPDSRMRAVPIAEPTPVYPWWLLWRDDLPEATLAQFLAATGFAASAPRLHPDTWVTANDAALLHAEEL